MDDTSLVAALQLADSFFPAGTVTFSYGLETFISQGVVSKRELPFLLEDYLHGKVAPCDVVAYAHAYRAAHADDLGRLRDIDHLLRATLLSQEIRQGSTRSGRALLDTLQASIDAPVFQRFAHAVRTGDTPGNSSVCLGVLCPQWEIPLRIGGLLMLYTFSVSFLGAALRLGLLGHRETQKILLDVRPRLPGLVDTALQYPLEEMGASAQLADIRTMQHAHLPVRLFSS
jgi:urease accessory protein